MEKTGVLAHLFALQDVQYRDFQAKLIPNILPEQIIGVRVPQLRVLGKELRGTPEAEEFLQLLPHVYYDENMLHGVLISGILDYTRCVAELNRFLPYVDCWAVCDTLSPKVLGKHREELLTEVRRWLASGETYTVRFGIGALMRYYLEDGFSPEYPQMVAEVRSEEYYVNMMRAWYFATALAKQYDAVLPFLTENRLDTWTHNKTIQKAVESYRITKEQKMFLRTLRRA